MGYEDLVRLAQDREPWRIMISKKMALDDDDIHTSTRTGQDRQHSNYGTVSFASDCPFVNNVVSSEINDYCSSYGY